MENIKPYNKYKPSLIDGLGDIPEHWERWKLNRVLFFQEGPGLRTWQFKDSGVKVICVTNITPPKISFAKMTKYISVEEYEEKYKHFTVEKGNILLASSGATWGKVSTYNDDEKVILNTSTIRLNTKKNELLSNSIVKHLLNANYVNTQLQNLLTGSCQPNFGPTHLNKLYVALPPLEEQTIIANFLDYKLAKIDRFIRKKKQLIKLLKEQKSGIINHAVTKGLDPNATMKNSGIEWLGDIPKDWEVRKLKYSVSLNQHREFSNEESKINKIALENIESKTGRLLVGGNSFEGIGTIFKKDDVLFGKLRPYLAKVLAPNFEGSCVNEILVLTPNKEIWEREFLKFRMLSSEFIKIVDNSTFGSKMPRASWDFIGGLKISCPPIEEQKAIVDYIEKETAKFNKVIVTIEKETALTQEYRKALITEVVTGKIDVRSYVIPNLEAEMANEELEDELDVVIEDEAEIEIE
ncbi:restriction endonuclease subunit S [Flavobacterium psychrophilum]|uniref:restriction endonuclease subunit S n=1 Tax=Flavobacterium psychrophilum TaxID=96345 RepID=UPI000B7C4303|nr:restriction endonuclease subunit S [Flavobacterium psychrophilum]EKT4502305.1 restriction endonuclease subunit S [Flavobacterium psychrophilum]MBF2024120.1 restriction endonuclease subunit S [Flavobacterium psychrophilum]MCB5984057.1 restriction endonuclease subunit S [Flavobacterium psychrophilum]MCB5995460.1 restriction endonuclease subunit S [Flavobacterium psychrophilum]MCB5997866.1 restriction endonuclease subunit S [Flavobacterium psychrophilum]